MSHVNVYAALYGAISRAIPALQRLESVSQGENQGAREDAASADAAQRVALTSGKALELAHTVQAAINARVVPEPGRFRLKEGRVLDTRRAGSSPDLEIVGVAASAAPAPPTPALRPAQEGVSFS